MDDYRARLRGLPSVDRLLSLIDRSELFTGIDHQAIVAMARAALAEAREAVVAGSAVPTERQLADALLERTVASRQPSLRRAINATGIVLHTNLGRAPVSAEAAVAMAEVSANYSNLELDLITGERGSRQTHVETLIRTLTGAESALVVNNNAGALLLCLAALAAGREVVVSRGQAVEIGGGFRIPDVLRESGATLVEVGTTNRTYPADYESARSDRTALFLHVHSSNFRVIGFAEEVSGPDLARLGARLGVPVLDDVGSGALLDTAQFGLRHEPMAQESVAAGAELVCFSGDKLLGGPQAGVIIGRRETIARVRRHPLARALRIDKVSLAGLEVTLRHYATGEAHSKIPLWRMLGMPLDQIAARAAEWARIAAGWSLSASVIASESAIGGGSLPGETLPTRVLAISAGAGGEVAPGITGVDQLAVKLRAGRIAVVGRIERDALLFDPRTVSPVDDAAFLAALRRAVVSGHD